MRNRPLCDDRLAESLLSIVTPPDRAAATVGDLLEVSAGAPSVTFWMAIARTFAALVWRDLNAARLAMAGSAAVGWLGFMLLALFWALLVQGIVIVIWVLAYVAAHHTGTELILDVLRLRFDWAPPPSILTNGAQLLAIVVVAPLQTGRLITQCWRERAVAFTVMQTLIWVPLVVGVPFVAYGVAVTIWILPGIQAFTLLGVVRERRRMLRTSSRLAA
jgi:hypothetical protein